jgi:ankyrin repeat protein
VPASRCAALPALALGLLVSASAGAQTPPSASEQAAYSGLLAAAARGEAARIPALVTAGARPDARDGHGRTPLHVAAYGGHGDAMRALAAAGADPNALENDRYDIVTIAAVANDVPTLTVALAIGASARNVTSRYDGTALIAAAHLGHAEVVRVLIRAGAPLDHVNNLGWSALIESIVLGDGGPRHTDTLKALVEAGASVTLPDRQGRTPLALAQARGYDAMVRLLRQAGARAGGGQGGAPCGEVLTLTTHAGTTTRYALAHPSTKASATAPPADPVALVLLVGGGGHLNLDDRGCPRALVGNSLVRSIPFFQAAGFVTALVDTPSDRPGEDGLAGFRVTREHAEDLGKVIADVRARSAGSVWLVGTSRGTLSAVNAAAQLTGTAAPDGLVLTSALMSGGRAGQKAWVSQTVFELPLEAVRVPVLVVGHAADSCPRSPASLMAGITARTNAAREQVVTVTGGPGTSTGAAGSIAACEGRAPHGFVDQEEAVVLGIARFIRGERY